TEFSEGQTGYSSNDTNPSLSSSGSSLQRSSHLAVVIAVFGFVHGQAGENLAIGPGPDVADDDLLVLKIIGRDDAPGLQPGQGAGDLLEGVIQRGHGLVDFRFDFFGLHALLTSRGLPASS